MYLNHTQRLRFKPPSHHEIGGSDSRGDFAGAGSTLLISKKHMHMTTNILLVALLVLASIGLIKSIDIERISKIKKDNDKSSE